MTRPAPAVAALRSPELRVRGLHVAYQRDVEILRGVDLTAGPGRITAVIGPNGAGKSTLLKGIGGIAPVIGGQVHLGADDITHATPQALLRQGMAFVPQEGTVFRDMTARENLVLGGWLRRQEREWLQRRVAEVAALFGMAAPHLQKRAGDLSGGQQKLLEIARSLVLMPATLLLDEPTAGLSPKMADQVYDRLRALPAEHGVTILLVDQNVRSALAIADHVYVIALGRNNAAGTAAEIGLRLDSIIAGWMREAASGAAQA